MEENEIPPQCLQEDRQVLRCFLCRISEECCSIVGIRGTERKARQLPAALQTQAPLRVALRAHSPWMYLGQFPKLSSTHSTRRPGWHASTTPFRRLRRRLCSMTPTAPTWSPSCSCSGSVWAWVTLMASRWSSRACTELGTNWGIPVLKFGQMWSRGGGRDPGDLPKENHGEGGFERGESKEGGSRQRLVT